jgi:hypothetical protein
MVKPPLRTKSIGFKVSEEEYTQLDAAAQTSDPRLRPINSDLPFCWQEHISGIPERKQLDAITCIQELGGN